MPLLSLKRSRTPVEDVEPFTAIHTWQASNALRLAEKAQSILRQASWAEIALRRDNSATDPNAESASLLATCMNPSCGTNWLRLWRNRQQPRFEGQWACSPACMREIIDSAIQREMGDDMRLCPEPHKHRIPLGLVLLSQGWITREQLRAALHAQRTIGKGRIGTWLMQQCGLPEDRVTRALSMQWGCPMFSLSGHQPSSVAVLAPRLLLDTYGILPLRVTAGRIAYLAFEDRIDAVAAHAIARINGLRTETGIVAGSQYLRSHESMMGAAFPKLQVADVADTRALGNVLTETIERLRPSHARLVRLHKYFWLRLWRTPMAAATPGVQAALLPRLHQVEDLLVSYTPQKD
jgi:hypothetical protein